METSRGMPYARADKPERIAISHPPSLLSSQRFRCVWINRFRVRVRVEECKEIETRHLMSR